MWIYDKKEQVKNQVKNYLNMDKFPEIKGYNFDNKFNFNDFINNYKNMAFQGSNLGLGIEIMNNIYKNKEKIKVYLSFTGNMISSGNREIITFLVKNKHVDAIVTTASGIEEDIIKTIKPFHLGTFDIKGEVLLNECIGRIGNIFVPADRYLYLERFINTIFPKISKEIKATHEVTNIIGKEIKENELTKDKHKESYLYWAYKNNIPIFCPGLSDGAIGDMAVFYKQKDKNLKIDIIKDNEILTKMLMNSEKTANITLGGGISKHFLLNAAIFRDGFDYSIYISTSQSFDGSDSGGNQEEAISWAKIKPNAERIKINCDATIAFPLLIASVLKNGNN